jgi:hypothetical protein
VPRRCRGRGHRSLDRDDPAADGRGLGPAPRDHALPRAPRVPLDAGLPRARTAGRPAGDLRRRVGRTAALQPRPAGPGVELDARDVARGRRSERGGRGARCVAVRPRAPHHGDGRGCAARRPPTAAAAPAGRPR